jgi:tetratricopeptide (TPR) repeat protein
LERYDFKKIGKFLEKQRLAKGLSLENLAQKGLSPSTIYRLEKGKPFKNMKKAINNYKKYCAALLGLSLDHVQKRISMEEPAEFKRRLRILEVSIDQKQSLEEDLERLNFYESSIFKSPHLSFLKAKTLFYMNRLDEAKDEALKVIELTEKENPDNLRSAAFNLLANYYYRQNEITTALEEVEKGIEAFDGEERLDIYYGLLSFKVILLEQSGRLEEGQEELEELIEHIHLIPVSHIRCLVYEYEARVLLSYKKYDEALNTVISGLELASRENGFSQASALWEVLGRIYEVKKDWDLAERAYQKALKLGKATLAPSSALITVYNRLGRLAMKQEKLDQAEFYLEKALSYGESYAGPRLLEAYASQGELFMKQGKPQEAIPILQQGLELAEKLNIPAQAQNLVSLILDCIEEEDENYVHYLERFYKLSKQRLEEVSR